MLLQASTGKYITTFSPFCADAIKQFGNSGDNEDKYTPIISIC